MNNQSSSDVPVQAYARCYPGATSVSRDHRRKIVASYVPSTTRAPQAPATVVETLTREERLLQKVVQYLEADYNRLVKMYLDDGETLEATESYVRDYLRFQIETANAITESERQACFTKLPTLTYTGPLPQQQASIVEESIPRLTTKVPGPHKVSHPHRFHTKSATARRRLNEAFARRLLCGQTVSDQEIERLKQAIVDAQREDAASSE